jgi:hypothetical protein
MGMTRVSNLKARAALLMVGLLATLLVLALSACGSGGSAQEGGKARPLPNGEKALRPGEYYTAKFKPSLSFRLGKGLTSAPPLLRDYIEIDGPSRGPSKSSRWIRFSNVKEVFKPGELGETVEAPKDLVGWFQHHPDLKTSEPKPVTVGGVKGVQFDVVVEDLPEDYYGMCGEECVDIYYLSDGEKILAYLEPKKRKVIVLEDVKGSTVQIDFGSSVSDFDDFLPEAQKVVESVKWSGS